MKVDELFGFKKKVAVPEPDLDSLDHDLTTSSVVKKDEVTKEYNITSMNPEGYKQIIRRYQDHGFQLVGKPIAQEEPKKKIVTYTMEYSKDPQWKVILKYFIDSSHGYYDSNHMEIKHIRPVNETVSK